MIDIRKQGAIDVVRIADAVTISTTAEIRAAIDTALKNGQPKIILDLSKVPMFDSAGLELLLDVHEQCVRRGGLFKVASANNLCQTTLEITGLDKSIEHYPDVLKAAGSFAI